MQDIQAQLNAPTLGLTARTIPSTSGNTRCRGFVLLKDKSLLLVLDNLETLLTDSDGWRDPLWGEVVAALLGHDGPSRVVLTSRRVPAGLANQPKVQVEAIHALSFAESVLLARELPNLSWLFDDEAGRGLLQQTLRVVQGHPKLLELADGLAADRPVLAARVAAAANELADRADVLDAFFAVGVTARGRDAAAGRRLRAGAAGVDGRRRQRPDAHRRAALRLPSPPGTGRPAAGHPGGQLEGLPDQAGGWTRRRCRRPGRARAGAAGGAGRAGSLRAGGLGSARPSIRSKSRS